MKVDSTFFGEITVDTQEIITFGKGLMGFEDKTQYVLMSNYDTTDPVPFMWLQSTQDPDLAFVISIPFMLRTDYEVEIPDNICDDLGITTPNDVGIYTICNIQDKVEEMTVNLASPLIINARNHSGVQLTLPGTTYTVNEKVKK